MHIQMELQMKGMQNRLLQKMKCMEKKRRKKQGRRGRWMQEVLIGMQMKAEAVAVVIVVSCLT
jgi:hypothetical protein